MIQGIINDYASVTTLDFCTNSVDVDDASAFTIGDTVLIIQMQGAEINNNDNANYGDIQNLFGAGNYEKLLIQSISGNTITFVYTIQRFYDSGGSVQIVSIPQYNDVMIMATLTAQDWNGYSGGVLIFEASGDVFMNAEIDLTGKGFRGGVGYDDVACWQGGNNPYSGYRCDLTTSCGGGKGEGIANFTMDELGRGPQASGGGGGNDHNTGGGGGSNYGAGGIGGERYNTSACLGPNPGIGGNSLTTIVADNKIFMGGGGGAGDENNDEGTDGKDGGGILIMVANSLDANAHSINSEGESQLVEAGSDGAGAGGAGGTVVLDVNSFSSNVDINVMGGKGGNVNDGYDFVFCMGPGGGGGGGVVWSSANSFPAQLFCTLSGGLPGMTNNFNAPPLCFNSNQGALQGDPGITLTDHSTLFNQSIFSPPSGTASNDTIICVGITVTLSANGGDYYVWSPAIGLSCSNCQSTDATPNVTTQYTVQIFVGNCAITDSVLVTVLPDPPADAGNNVAICLGDSVQLNGSGGGFGATFSWDPSTGLSCTNCQNPIASPTITTTYTINVSVPAGCIGTDEVTVVVSSPTANAGADQLICDSTAVNLFATGGVSYSWSPATGLSCTNCQNPSALPSSTTTYTVTVTDATGCTNIDTVDVIVGSYPEISIQGDTIICVGETVQIFASGGAIYSWSPSTGLSCTNCANPFASPSANTNYTLNADDGNGCITSETISFIVNPLPNVDAGNDTIIFSGTTITLDGQGIGIVQWNPNTSLSSDTILNPQSTPEQTIIYILSITDQNGCFGYDTVQITILPSNQDVFVPNAFTPNADGNNDLFIIYPIGGIELLEFSIYNRWGEVIFTTNDFAQGWDGRYNNLVQDIGTFIYLVRAKTFEETELVKKGNLTLLK